MTQKNKTSVCLRNTTLLLLVDRCAHTQQRRSRRSLGTEETQHTLAKEHHKPMNEGRETHDLPCRSWRTRKNARVSENSEPCRQPIFFFNNPWRHLSLSRHTSRGISAQQEQGHPDPGPARAQLARGTEQSRSHLLLLLRLLRRADPPCLAAPPGRRLALLFFLFLLRVMWVLLNSQRTYLPCPSPPCVGLGGRRPCRH